jgi:putative aldouronate transport system permease protein
MKAQKSNLTDNLGMIENIPQKIKRIFSFWQIYVLLLPAIIYVFIFSYMPMYGVQIAFKNFRTSLGIWDSEWVGLKHFIRFVTFPNFWLYIKNTILISFYSICTFPCAIILALLINEINNNAFKRTVQMITYMPHFISIVVVCGMIVLFFSKSTGIVNSGIEFLGFDRVNFLGEAKYFRHLYVWSGVWQNVGWGTIIYIAALTNVSPDLVMASKVDGANRFQTIIHVKIPTIASTIIIMFIMNCGRILTVGFEKIYLMQNALNLSVSQVLSTYIYEVGLVGGQFSYSTAIGLFNTVVNVFFLVIVNIVSKKVSSISLW